MWCAICKEREGVTRTITHDDEVVLERPVCQPCWDKAYERYQELRARYDAFLEEGWPPKKANEMMFELIKQDLAA